MTAPIRPATALPWFDDDASGSKGRYIGNGKNCVVSAGEVSKRDAAYIAHAANAYPKLVKALLQTIRHGGDGHPVTEGHLALLRSLGEAK